MGHIQGSIVTCPMHGGEIWSYIGKEDIRSKNTMIKTNSLSVTESCMHIYIGQLDSMSGSPEWPAYCLDSDLIALSRDLSVMESVEDSRF